MPQHLSSLRARALLLLSFAFVVMLSMMSYHVISERAERLVNIKLHLEHLAKLIAAEQDNLLEHAESVLLRLTLDSAILQAKSTGECASLLGSALSKQPEFTNMGVVDLNGNIVCNATPSPRIINVSDRAYFQQALKGGDDVAAQIVVARTTGKSAVTFARPMREYSGQMRGVVFVSLDLSWIGRQLSSGKRIEGAAIALVDSQGTVLAGDPDINGWVGRSIVETPLFKTLVAQGGAGTTEELGLDGVRSVYAFTPFVKTIAGPVFLLVGVAKDIAMAPSKRAFEWTIIGTLLLLTFTFGLVLAGGTHWFVRPVLALAATAERLRRGDLTARTGVAHTNDELGRLAYSFDDMAEALELKEQQIGRSNRALRVLSAGNRALFRTDDENALLGEMCKVVVEAGGYRMAWVGFAEDDSEKSVRPVASFAAPPAFLRDLQISWAGTERGMGPVGVAIRGGIAVATQNILTDPQLKPWQELAQHYAYCSVLALPLKAKELVIGALVIYAKEPDAFDDAEVKLLLQAADDLTFGIATHRARAREQRLEASLKTAEERFHAAAEANLDALFILKSVRDDTGGIVDFEFTDVNASAEKILRIPLKQVIGVKLSEVPLSDQIDSFLKRCAEVVNTGKPIDEEFHIKALEPITKWVRHQVVATNDGIAISSRDITAAKATAVALIESERRYRLLFEIHPNPMWVYDLDTLDFLEVNQAAINRYGYTRDEFLQMTISKIRPVDDTARFEKYIGELVHDNSDGLKYSGKWRHIKSNGEMIDVEIASHSVEFSGKQARLVLASDISEQIRTEEKRRQLEIQLRESQKLEAIGTLAGGIAHDFNNILAAILGNVALAQKDAIGDSSIEVSLEEINKAAVRAKILVQQILTFSRRQSHDMAIQPLGPIVEEVTRLLRATIPPQVDITITIAHAQHLVLANATQIHQVVMNLCTNAWHAIGNKPGHIAVSLDEVALAAGQVQFDGMSVGDYARIRVTDSGCGMDNATQARIFEPFFTTKSVSTGTGLGLAVAHGIVKSHRGAITVRSAPGLGTTFDVYLPVTQAFPNLIRAEQPISQVKGDGQRVIYVDDDEAMVFLVTRMLENVGYRVFGFARGEDALMAVQDAPAAFDLVVTDFNMPGLSGLDVARGLRRIRPALPVIITSGYVTEALTADALSAGVREVMHKPNTVDELCRSIQQLLRSL